METKRMTLADLEPFEVAVDTRGRLVWLDDEDNVISMHTTPMQPFYSSQWEYPEDVEVDLYLAPLNEIFKVRKKYRKWVTL